MLDYSTNKSERCRYHMKSRSGKQRGYKKSAQPTDEENQSIESVKGQNSHYYQSIKDPSAAQV